MPHLTFAFQIQPQRLQVSPRERRTLCLDHNFHRLPLVGPLGAVAAWEEPVQATGGRGGSSRSWTGGRGCKAGDRGDEGRMVNVWLVWLSFPVIICWNYIEYTSKTVTTSVSIGSEVWPDQTTSYDHDQQCSDFVSKVDIRKVYLAYVSSIW